MQMGWLIRPACGCKPSCSSDHVPDLAKGSYDAIEYWCDRKTLREEFAEDCEKNKMWDILKEKSE